MADELYKIYKEKPFNYEDAVKISDKISYFKGKFTNDKYEAMLNKCGTYFEDRLAFDNAYTENKTALFADSKTREKVKQCINNLKNNKQIHYILNPCEIIEKPQSLNEATILIDLKCTTPSKDEVIVKFKAKLDNFTVEYNTITLNDLKTTGHLIEEFGTNSFFKYHYYRQMGAYLWLLYLLNQKEYKYTNPTFNCNMLLVSTIPPFNTGVFKVSNKMINEGIKEFSDLIKRVAYLELYG